MRLTPEQMPQIGPFSLIEPAGSGAMAEVWRAVHREQRVAVAIKFMTGAQARQALFRQRFAAEVRAAARLSHHGIVQLADYGTVETALDHPHLQHLMPGSPYLVMEWVPGGTLRSRLGRMQWPEIKATLLALLDALSVAHAHELVHRDIKPDNVLLSERGPLLTDFGVAFATDSTDAHSSNHTMVGTPNYMAPEQVRGDWRAFGPWTDLYALGCLAYALVEGRAPYSGADFNEIFRGHLKGRLPVFSDERGLPEGFLAWVHRLMAKRTGQRFRFAADAAVALLDLPPPESDTRPVFGAAVDTSPGPTIVAPAAFVPVSDMSWALAERRGSLPGIPLRWHEPPAPRSLPPLSDTGRSLFDLAAPPLFGREDERNILWAALRRSSHHDCLRSVVITGQAGQGKSAIAHWLGRRAHGLGVAQRHVIRHESIATTTCGLRGMLHRLFRVGGLTDEDVRARTRAVMQECGLLAYAAAASQIIVDSAPEPEKEGQSLVVSQRDRFEVVGQILAHLCRDRAQLILVDDLQWGNETIELIQYLIRHWYRLPLLFVCTVREDGSEHDRRVRRLLAPITQGETCETIALGPLSEDAHTQLLTHRLALDDTTIRTLAARSAKNPLFTRELISHFIAEGTLVPGSNGYRLRPGGTVSLPDSVRGVWEARLHAVLGSLDDGARSILEVAAALGHSFQLRHLVSVCRGISVKIEYSWIERFLDSRLLEPNDVGTLSFAHNLLRETLLSERKSEQNWSVVHSVCARVLRKAEQPSRTQIAAHHLAAGEYAEALSEQLKEADVQRYRSNYEQALRVLLNAFLTYKAGRRSGLKPRCIADVRWRWAICARVLGRFVAAKRHATKTWSAGQAYADVSLEARGRLEMGRCLEATVGARSALPVYQDAVAVARSGEPTKLLIHCVGALAKAYRTMSKFDKAREFYRESLALGRRYGTANDTGVILLGLARIELITGQFQAGKTIATDALALFQEVGSKWGLGQAHGLLGDAERLLGDLALAEKAYREAAAHLHATRSIDAPYSDANLGIVLMELGRFDEASKAFEQAIEQVRQIGTKKAYLSITAVSLYCDVSLQALSRFDSKVVELQALMNTTLADLDIAIFAHKCADALTQNGERDRAEFVWHLAVRQYEILGRTQTAEDVRAQWRAQVPVV